MADVLYLIVAHAACIILHIGLAATSIYAFNSLGVSAAIGASNGASFSGATDTVIPWAAFGVSLVIILFNITLLVVLLRLERRSSTSTSESRRFKKTVALVIGLIFNGAFVVADVAFAGVSGAKSATPMKVLCALAVLGAISALATVVFDILKTVQVRRQGKEVDHVLRNMEP